MKIGLIGYGRMGQEIEQAALKRGHNIQAVFDKDNPPSEDELSKCDVAIDFSWPEGVLSNIEKCLQAGVPIVVGTTGWYEHLESVREKFQKNNGALLYASNCSLGVNILFRVNKMLAEMMGPYSQYEPSIKEIHHTGKKDAPSGTAITLAEDLIESIPSKSQWESLPEEEKNSSDEKLPVFWRREGDVKGYHQVAYTSEIDRLTLSHEAFSREGFAVGAVIAAEWLKARTGVFSMQDLLDQF